MPCLFLSQEVNTLKSDIKSLNEDVKQYEGQIAEAEKSLADAQDVFETLKKTLQSAEVTSAYFLQAASSERKGRVTFAQGCQM